MNVEEEYTDVLQNIEFAIVSVHQEHPLLVDFDVENALKGVKYREASSQSLLTRNLLVYGLGGIVLPFVAIKAIDLLLTLCGMA